MLQILRLNYFKFQNYHVKKGLIKNLLIIADFFKYLYFFNNF